jgi:hypothetical protein
VDPALPYGDAMNGGATSFGRGTLHDLGGDDAYLAVGLTANGGAGDLTGLQGIAPIPAVGLLRDEGGRDTYLDGLVSCADCTLVPKGVLGAQIDVAP